MQVQQVLHGLLCITMVTTLQHTNTTQQHRNVAIQIIQRFLKQHDLRFCNKPNSDIQTFQSFLWTTHFGPRFSHFASHGFRVFSQRRTVGGMRRLNLLCAQCTSNNSFNLNALHPTAKTFYLSCRLSALSISSQLRADDIIH